MGAALTMSLTAVKRVMYNPVDANEPQVPGRTGRAARYDHRRTDDRRRVSKARMTQLRTRGARLPVLGGILGITGLIGLLRVLGRRSRRPTGDQLLKMSDADFASFIRSSGLKTVTTAGLAPREGNAD